MNVRAAWPTALLFAVSGLACAVHSHPVGPTPDPGASQAGPSSQSTAMTRVINGLRPLVDPDGPRQVRWPLGERMSHYHVPGASIAMIVHNRIAWVYTTGVMIAGGTDSIRPTTLFQAASISKPVTMTAMLRLVDDGQLDLDADVNRYLTTWQVPDTGAFAQIPVTLRELASHTAGTTPRGFMGYAPGAPLPTPRQILAGQPPATSEALRVVAMPGSEERYSGGGTVLVQQLLEDATHRPFSKVMEQEVLEPLGMRRSMYEQPLPAGFAGDAARGHDDAGRPLPGGWRVYPELGPAGLWSTPSDVARWVLAVGAAWRGESHGFLTQTTAQQMLRRQPLRGGDGARRYSHFGLGPGIDGSGDSLRMWHDGANVGYRSKFIFFPALGTGVVLMTNGEGADSLMMEVVRAVADEYQWPAYGSVRVKVVTLSDSAMASLTGTYMPTSGRQNPAEVRVVAGRLVFMAPGFEEELIPESDTSFVGASLGWRWRFSRDTSGRAWGLDVVRDDGVRVEARRLPR